MSSYIPILMFIPRGGGGIGPLSIEAAWIVGIVMFLLACGGSSVLGLMAYLIWDNDLRFLSILCGVLSAATLIGCTYLIIIGIIIPAYGV